jgi:hypothetical protein
VTKAWPFGHFSDPVTPDAASQEVEVAINKYQEERNLQHLFKILFAGIYFDLE